MFFQAYLVLDLLKKNISTNQYLRKWLRECQHRISDKTFG